MTIKTDSKQAMARITSMSLPPNSPPSVFGKLPSPYTCLQQGTKRLPFSGQTNCENPS